LKYLPKNGASSLLYVDELKDSLETGKGNGNFWGWGEISVYNYNFYDTKCSRNGDKKELHIPKVTADTK
jgi:hypothetical protein